MNNLVYLSYGDGPHVSELIYSVLSTTQVVASNRERLKKMGIENLDKVYKTEELAPGKNVIFAACGVTDGSLLKGVRYFGDGIRTQTLVMMTVPHQVRFIDTIHAKDDPDVKIRF